MRGLSSTSGVSWWSEPRVARAVTARPTPAIATRARKKRRRGKNNENCMCQLLPQVWCLFTSEQRRNTQGYLNWVGVTTELPNCGTAEQQCETAKLRDDELRDDELRDDELRDDELRDDELRDDELRTVNRE